MIFFFLFGSSAGGREAVPVHPAHSAANTAPLRTGLPPPQKQPAFQGGGGVTRPKIEWVGTGQEHLFIWTVSFLRLICDAYHRIKLYFNNKGLLLSKNHGLIVVLKRNPWLCCHLVLNAATFNFRCSRNVFFPPVREFSSLTLFTCFVFIRNLSSVIL